MRRTVLFALALLTALSCSIKEDRTGCPCSLTVVLVEAGGPDGDDLVLGISGLPDERIPGTRIPESLERCVEKGVHRVTAFSGGELSIPYGDACGPLMARSESIECLLDKALYTLRLQKQYIVLTFRTDHTCGGIVVRSRWAGLSVEDLSPAEGRFRAEAARTSPGEFKVLLPRQGDASMVADILGGDGAVLQTIKAGAFLEAAGFDFSAANLDDAIICLEYGSGAFSVTVEDWQSGAEDEINV